MVLHRKHAGLLERSSCCVSATVAVDFDRGNQYMGAFYQTIRLISRNEECEVWSKLGVNFRAERTIRLWCSEKQQRVRRENKQRVVISRGDKPFEARKCKEMPV